MGVERVVGREKRRRELEDVEEGRGSKDIAGMFVLHLDSSCQPVFLSRNGVAPLQLERVYRLERKQQIKECEMEQ